MRALRQPARLLLVGPLATLLPSQSGMAQDCGQTSVGPVPLTDLGWTYMLQANRQPGETWTFQSWHRSGGGNPATFSEAVRVTFE